VDDAVFTEEQEHLTHTYEKLCGIRNAQLKKIRATSEEATRDLGSMRDERSLDFAEVDHTAETMIELEAMNSIIAGYQRTANAAEETLRRAEMLMRQPYFARIDLQLKEGAPARSIYLGSVGIADETRRHFIVDWRSPVAEVYYNQSNGATQYEANGRTIHANLKLRRQFDITRDTLNAYFDTTVAIEDPLLLKALGSRHSEKLHAITATIQREQNEVVRHEDVPALVVNGIAGSGKTSVLLQRIAYLLYRNRENLTPDQVYLFTPNPVFGRYIDDVLPSMGEKNPQIFTWRSFVESQGLADRGMGEDTAPTVLQGIADALPGLTLDPHDFREIAVDGTVLLKASQVQSAARKYEHVPVGPRFSGLMVEELHDRLDRRFDSMAHDEALHDEMLSLDVDDMVRYFGSAIAPSTQEETVNLAKEYVQARYAVAHEAIENLEWLRFDRIGMRVTGQPTVSAVEWLYLKARFAGTGCRSARYVMVDEVQDYTEAQLMVLAHWFGNAHFLLLGDEHQAIREHTATFPKIREVFARAKGEVSECRLLTSYRSTPEITSLFCGLVHGSDIQATSVQREGQAPTIQACSRDAAEYLAALRAQIEVARERGGLTAIVAESHDRVRWLARELGARKPDEAGEGDIVLMRPNASLPAAGVVLIDLPLAKGLEFDAVIVPDAQDSVYPDTPLARRRLYTAISRATHFVSVLSQGPLTPLLA